MTTVSPPISPTPLQEPDVPPRGSPQRSAWTPGLIIGLVVGLLVLVGGVGCLAVGGVVLQLDHQSRDGDYLTTESTRLEASGYAVTVEEIDFDDLPSGLSFGQARVRVTAADPGAEVFVGLADSDDAAEYLAGVSRSTLAEIDDPSSSYHEHRGRAPSDGPVGLDIWIAQAAGTGTQTIDWSLERGSWTVVIMNADGSAGIDVDADAGMTAPWVRGIAIGLLAAGGLAVLAGGTAATVIGRSVARTRTTSRSTR